jgi:thymidylate kinase
MKLYNFTVISGLDGIGKGTIEKAILEYENSRGSTIFDSVSFSLKQGRLPSLEECGDADIVLTAEPTRCGIGKVIREEIVAKNGRSYSSNSQIQAYSLDRLVQMKSLVIPLLEDGRSVVQSRCFAETLNYQLLEALREGKDPQKIREYVLSQEGSQLELNWAPSLLIIPTIKNVDELMKRIEARKADGKDDNCVFENPDFQRKLKPLFEDIWLKNLFEGVGTEVRYLDAGISVEETKRQALDIYSKHVNRFKSSNKDL